MLIVIINVCFGTSALRHRICSQGCITVCFVRVEKFGIIIFYSEKYEKCYTFRLLGCPGMSDGKKTVGNTSCW